MMKDSGNKMMKAADATTKDDVTFKAASGVLYDFFFPGSGGKWKPLTVRAQTREEAQQFWEANREPAQPEERSEEIKNNDEQTT